MIPPRDLAAATLVSLILWALIAVVIALI